MLETRPIYHKCDDTIRGHVFCSFLALVLFLVGISRMFPSIKVRLALQVLAAGLLLLGAGYAITGSIA